MIPKPLLINENPRAYIIYIDDISEQEVSSLIDSLPSWRRERTLDFKFLQGRKESAVAFHLLRYALRMTYGITDGIEFEYEEHGKPSLIGHPDIHFNLSHCKSVVACVVGDSPVGIDAEQIGRYRESLAEYTMNSQEMAKIRENSCPDEIFTQLWTKKESILKLIGVGLTDDIKNVIICNPDILSITMRLENAFCSVAWKK